MIEQARTTADRADKFAAMENAPEGIKAIGNLIRYAKGPEGLVWIAENCEGQAKYQTRVHHAAQFSVISKHLRRVVAHIS